MRRASAMCLALFLAPDVSLAADRWYDNPANPRIDYRDLSRPTDPARVQIKTVVLAEGHWYFSQNLPIEFHDLVAAALVKSGFAELSHDSDDLHLEFHLDIDPKDASVVERRGPGSRVNWVQELVVYAPVKNGWMEYRYQRSILVFRGAAQEPEGLGPPLDARKARDLAIEAMVLQALQDLQREGFFSAPAPE